MPKSILEPQIPMLQFPYEIVATNSEKLIQVIKFHV